MDNRKRPFESAVEFSTIRRGVPNWSLPLVLSALARNAPNPRDFRSWVAFRLQPTLRQKEALQGR
jgi:hypothetical protein